MKILIKSVTLRTLLHFCIWLTSIHASTKTLYLFQARSHTNFSFLPNFFCRFASSKINWPTAVSHFVPVRDRVPYQVTCFALAGGWTELSSYHFSERCVMALYNLAKQNDGIFSSLLFHRWPCCYRKGIHLLTIWILSITESCMSRNFLPEEMSCSVEDESLRL